jgi:hypothetical protein
VGAQETLRVGGVGGFLPYAPTATLLYSAMGAPPGMEARAPLSLGSALVRSHCVRGKMGPHTGVRTAESRSVPGLVESAQLSLGCMHIMREAAAPRSA